MDGNKPCVDVIPAVPIPNGCVQLLSWISWMLGDHHWWASHVSLVCHWWCHWYILVLVFGMVSIPKIWRLSRCQSVKTEVSTTGESWRFKPPNIGDSYDQDLGMKWDFSALETTPCSRMFKTSRLVSECFRYITQGHMRFFSAATVTI